MLKNIGEVRRPSSSTDFAVFEQEKIPRFVGKEIIKHKIAIAKFYAYSQSNGHSLSDIFASQSSAFYSVRQRGY